MAAQLLVTTTRSTLRGPVGRLQRVAGTADRWLYELLLRVVDLDHEGRGDVEDR
jgi:hypothetical protein